MIIEFIKDKEPKISKVYKKAVTGDHDAIRFMCDYYDKKDMSEKALSWYLFGAHFGYKDFMKDVCIHIIVIQYEYPEDKRMDLLLNGLYWAYKLKENMKGPEDLEIAKRITGALQGLIAKNIYNSFKTPEKFREIQIPKI